jgi:hypothetical protein
MAADDDHLTAFSKPWVQGVRVKVSAGFGQGARHAYVPTEFHEVTDIAECALDDQLEQLQRQYASASRAVSSTRLELELLENRGDASVAQLAYARQQQAAAETRSFRLLNALEALEDRLENA